MQQEERVGRYDFTVEFDQVDAGEVMYHPNYLVVFDRARSQHLRAFGVSLKTLWEERFTLVVAQAEIVYRRPALYGASLSVLTRMVHRSQATVRCTQKIFLPEAVPQSQDEQRALLEGNARAGLVTSAQITLVAFDLDRKRSRAIPPQLAAALSVD